MLDKLLRTDEVAEILDIPAERVATMARQGLLPAVRCGRSWRFAPSRLRQWMEWGGAGGWKRPSPVRTGLELAIHWRPEPPVQNRLHADRIAGCGSLRQLPVERVNVFDCNRP